MHRVPFWSFSALIIFATTLSAHEELEIHVGRTAAGQLTIHTHFDQPVELPPSIFGGISGYAIGELALHSTSQDDPDEDLFQLSTAVNLRFILLAKDPGVEVWNDTGSAYMATNELFFIGSSPFDTHPIWNIPQGPPGIEYSLTLMLRDLNGIYQDSLPFTLTFTPEPEYHLRIAQAGSTRIALSWSTNAVEWSLVSAAFPGANAWNPVTNSPVIVGTNQFLELPVDTAQKFFRLKK